MKKLIILLCAVTSLLALAGCNQKSMNDIIADAPSILGIVKDTGNHAILIENKAGEYWVSLDVENKDSMTHFSVGDEVVVYYDGMIAESYPMQINRVYAITLRTPANRAENDESAATEEADGDDWIPMVMIDGVLYCDTGKESTITARCGMMDGEITSAVEQDQMPTENDQSNFGTGYGYQYGIHNTIEISIDGTWWVFAVMEDMA